MNEWRSPGVCHNSPHFYHFESAQSLSNYDVQYLVNDSNLFKCHIYRHNLICQFSYSELDFCCDMDCRWMPPGQGAELRGYHLLRAERLRVFEV